MTFYFFTTDFPKDPYSIEEEFDLSEKAKFTFGLRGDVDVTKLSFLLMRHGDDHSAYIGKIYDKRRVTTFDNSFSVREVIKLHGPDLERLIVDTQGTRRAKSILASRYPVRLQNAEQVKIAILENNHGMIGNNYFDFDRLVGGRYSDVIPQFTDAFGMSLSIFGLDPRDIPPLREEQILDFEIEGMFPNQLGRTPDGKRYFEHAGKRLYIQKVHNTTIERCLGVDVIYNFVDEERAVFIQYKCFNDGKKQDGKKYYRSKDHHFPKELERMRSIPGVRSCHNFGADNRSDLRICGCPVFVKLCSREIKGKRVMPYGFYYPICIWDHIYSTPKNNSITFDDKPRITNDQFKELVESGLLGSVPQQTRAISTHLVNESGDERLKLIFTESSQ